MTKDHGPSINREIGGSSHPQTCRPHQTRTKRKTSRGANHGKAQTQDPGHVYSLPRRHPCRTTCHDNDGVIIGEPDAQKVSTSGSAGGRY